MSEQTKKRKLDCKTIEVKYQAIKEVENGKEMKSVIAEKYGGVKPNTLSTWIKNKESIKQSYEGRKEKEKKNWE